MTSRSRGESFSERRTLMALVGRPKDVSLICSLAANRVPKIGTESAKNLCDHVSKFLSCVVSNTNAAASVRRSDMSLMGKQLIIQ